MAASRNVKIFVSNKLINPDQVAYIHDRFIGSNVRLVLDTMGYITNSKKGGLLFFLDFRKAFDSIEWNFMFECLKKYNFGPDFIQWVKLLYTQPLTCIKNNGYISDIFELEKGIRQGCLL